MGDRPICLPQVAVTLKTPGFVKDIFAVASPELELTTVCEDAPDFTEKRVGQFGVCVRVENATGV